MPVAAPRKNEKRGARVGQTGRLPSLPERPHEGIKANCQFALPFSEETSRWLTKQKR
jgi:hypothetical protein